MVKKTKMILKDGNYYCPFCGRSLEGTESFCPTCGVEKPLEGLEKEEEEKGSPKEKILKIPEEIEKKKSVTEEKEISQFWGEACTCVILLIMCLIVLIVFLF